MLESAFHLQFSIAPVLLAIAGIALATILYRKPSDQPARIAAAFGALYRAAYRKLYIDEIYVFITKKILFNIVGNTAAWIDKNVVDGLVNLTASGTQAFSMGIRKLQSGKVQQYAIYFLGGVILLAALFIYAWNN